MLSWLLDHLPWWVIPSLGAAALVAAFVTLRAFGFTARQVWAMVGAGASAIGAATVYQYGRNAGVRSAGARQRRADENAVRTRDEIDDAVAGRTADENRRRLWVRKR